MLTTFSYTDTSGANPAVFVAGEWNSFAAQAMALDSAASAGAKTRLQNAYAAVYTLALDLAPGIYAYKFLLKVSGKSDNWILDPFGVTGKYNNGVLNNVVLVGGFFPGAAQPLAGGTVISWGCNYYDTLSADRALTFAQLIAQISPGASCSLKLTVTGGARTLTFPPSYRVGDVGTPISSLVFQPGTHELSWVYDGGAYWLDDSAS